MKYMKRSNIYKASNVTFNPTTMDAHSYEWWRFVAKVDGKLVFNNYKYSPSTGRHQRKVSALLESLNIKIDLSLPLPKGIIQDESLESLILIAEEHLCDEILENGLKQQDRNDRTRIKRKAKRLNDFLTTVKDIGSYQVRDKAHFGTDSSQGIHQIVDVDTPEVGVLEALETLQKDGFKRVIFYV